MIDNESLNSKKIQKYKSNCKVLRGVKPLCCDVLFLLSFGTKKNKRVIECMWDSKGWENYCLLKESLSWILI